MGLDFFGNGSVRLHLKKVGKKYRQFAHFHLILMP